MLNILGKNINLNCILNILGKNNFVIDHDFDIEYGYCNLSH